MGRDRTATSPAVARTDLRLRGDDGLLLVDADGVVRLLDPRARELLGDGLELGGVAPSLVLDAESVVVRRRGPSGDVSVELRVQRAQVDEREGWVVGVADISDRRGDPQEVSEFVSTVCHEMRTPLTGIIGYADALREGWDDLDEDRRTSFLGVILREGARLTRLTADLGALARPGRGIDVRPESVSLDDAVAETLAVLREEGEAVTVTGETGLRVRVDGSHFENILTNLLVNAHKYGRPPIVVDVERQDVRAVVRVRDHGDGVPDGFVHRMWDRFSRAREDERPSGIPGSGLGLAVVASLVAINGGHVWYERDEPTGAVFCVAFPLAVSGTDGADGADGSPTGG